MKKGRSLHVGLSFTSRFRWGRLTPPLPSPVKDAKELARVAAARRFSAATLLNEDATMEAVRGAVDEAARGLRAGDTFVLTFSGHGLAAGTREGFQQSWCLFDGALVRFGRDGLDALLTRFQKGVRILVVANCCFASPPRDAAVRSRRIRADVVRIGAGTAITVASDSRKQTSPFVRRFIDVLKEGDYRGFHGFFRELTFYPMEPMKPQLEIGPRCSEDFLRLGPFRIA